MNFNKWLVVGGISGFLAVGFGAFGAHGVEAAIPSWYTTADLSDPSESGEKKNMASLPEAYALNQLHSKKLRTWMTGVRYHFYHALAILIVGTLVQVNQIRSRWLDLAAAFFLLGILGFSGSIYLLVISKVKILGMTAAIGGTLMLIGWGFFVVGVKDLSANQAKRTGGDNSDC